MIIGQFKEYIETGWREGSNYGKASELKMVKRKRRECIRQL